MPRKPGSKRISNGATALVDLLAPVGLQWAGDPAQGTGSDHACRVEAVRPLDDVESAVEGRALAGQMPVAAAEAALRSALEDTAAGLWSVLLPIRASAPEDDDGADDDADSVGHGAASERAASPERRCSLGMWAEGRSVLSMLLRAGPLQPRAIDAIFDSVRRAPCAQHPLRGAGGGRARESCARASFCSSRCRQRMASGAAAASALHAGFPLSPHRCAPACGLGPSGRMPPPHPAASPL